MWQQYYSSEECDQDTISVSQFRFTHSSADQFQDTMPNATFALHLSLIGFYASISIIKGFNLPFDAIYPIALRDVGNFIFPLLQLQLLFVGIILFSPVLLSIMFIERFVIHFNIDNLIFNFHFFANPIINCATARTQTR